MARDEIWDDIEAGWRVITDDPYVYHPRGGKVWNSVAKNGAWREGVELGG